MERLEAAACTDIPRAQRGGSLVASAARGLRNLLCFALLLQDLGFGGFPDLGEMVHLCLAPQGGKGSQVPEEVLQGRRKGQWPKHLAPWAACGRTCWRSGEAWLATLRGV